MIEFEAVIFELEMTFVAITLVPKIESEALTLVLEILLVAFIESKAVIVDP